MQYQWNTDNTITIEPPKKPLKITGTRFASILELNPWNTPFQQWCEITRAYRPPFEDTKYTLAGKAIEPKQIEYMREAYGMDNLIEPSDIWGKDFFKKTWGNFFTDRVFGGMWDSLLVDDEWDGTPEGLVGHTEAVIEFKTTKRVEDWEDDVPEYYALQAALYAYLLKCDNVIMVASFLRDTDYDDPDAFVPDASNTITYEFSVDDRYPDFDKAYVQPALMWFEDHIKSGESPMFDEVRDKEYLDELRKVSINPDSSIEDLINEFMELNNRVSVIESTIAGDKKRIANIKTQLKAYAEENIGNQRSMSFGDNRVQFKLSKTSKSVIDEDRMKSDGIYEDYLIDTDTARFTVKIGG